MCAYLGTIEGEAGSPSAREVATVLETVAERAHHFARYLYTLDFRLPGEGTTAINTAGEAAADILKKALIKPEDQSVLAAALRGNEVLAAVAARQAKKLVERSKKGRAVQGAATAWTLRQLAELMWDNGLPSSMPPKSGDSLCALSEHFWRLALIRAEALREPEWARKEIQVMRMLTERVFADRLRQAVLATERGFVT